MYLLLREQCTHCFCNEPITGSLFPVLDLEFQTCRYLHDRSNALQDHILRNLTLHPVMIKTFSNDKNLLSLLQLVTDQKAENLLETFGSLNWAELYQFSRPVLFGRPTNWKQRFVLALLCQDLSMEQHDNSICNCGHCTLVFVLCRYNSKSFFCIVQ